MVRDHLHSSGNSGEGAHSSALNCVQNLRGWVNGKLKTRKCAVAAPRFNSILHSRCALFKSATSCFLSTRSENMCCFMCCSPVNTRCSGGPRARHFQLPRSTLVGIFRAPNASAKAPQAARGTKQIELESSLFQHARNQDLRHQPYESEACTSPHIHSTSTPPPLSVGNGSIRSQHPCVSGGKQRRA